MLSSKFWAPALCLAIMSCGGDEAPRPPEAAEVFPNLPLPVNARFVSRAGGDDALQLTLHSPEPVEKIVAYYRGVLSKGGWRLVKDTEAAGDVVVLYAEQDGPPLWVQIRSAGDGNGTLVDLAGAVVPGGAKKAGEKPAAKPRAKAEKPAS
ncbi:MAG: hypothetical protein H0T44_16550 [Gemmatimonadales bacterium]|nr:hypothetical protein [Gemmatimonadales bacterium]MDQ3426705.1 hypothetical protein [Gemmatimonadota bacterium]